MPAQDTDIPIAFLRECFDVNFDTGELTWKRRPREHFKTARGWAVYNALSPGTLAGSLGEDYLRVGLTFDDRRRSLLAHRIIFTLTHGRWPEHQIDHEKGPEAGNRIVNLREATNAQNGQNQKIRRSNTSGFPGVRWERRSSKWEAEIRIGNRRFFLGHFTTREAAFTAYLAAKAIVHPFAPVPRGVKPPELHSLDRLAAAQRIIRAARRFGDPALECDAVDHLFAPLF